MKTAGSVCRYYNWGPMLYKNYGPSGYDRTHMFSAGWNYELPVGKGKQLAISNKAADALIGGWKLSGIFVAYSGHAVHGHAAAAPRCRPPATARRPT